MKRATKAWLRLVIRDDMDKGDSPARDALDSDARQAAEIRRLRKACQFFNFPDHPEGHLSEGELACTRALKRSRR